MTIQSNKHKGRLIGFALGVAVLLSLIAFFVLRSGETPSAKKKRPNVEEKGEFPTPRVVDPVRVQRGTAETEPDMPETNITERTIPPELAGRTRNWSPESSEFRMPEPGEEAPVRAYNLETYDPAQPGPPPNPFIPPKAHLTEEDTRAGLDPVPE